MLKGTETAADAMKIGPTQMKREYEEVNIDQIDTLQDEMEDMLDMVGGEVHGVLARDYNTPEVRSKFELASTIVFPVVAG